MRISSFAMELRTNVLVYMAHTYLYVYRDVPSKRCFSFTWGIYLAVPAWGRQGRWQGGCWLVATFTGGGCSPSCSPWGRLHCCSRIRGAPCRGCLVELTCHGWKSQWCTWRWLHHTPLPTASAKTFPVPANVSLSPWIANVFLHLIHLLRVLFFCPLQMNFQVQWKFCLFFFFP